MKLKPFLRLQLRYSDELIASSFCLRKTPVAIKRRLNKLLCVIIKKLRFTALFVPLIEAFCVQEYEVTGIAYRLILQR